MARGAVVGVVVTLVLALAGTAAGNGQRFPVMGCAGRYGLSDLEYRPSHCRLQWDQLGPDDLLNDLWIQHVRWSHWGSLRQAAGVGEVVFRASGPIPAKLVAFGLISSRDPRICRLGGSAYAKLRINWQSYVDTHGNRKPSGSHVFGVTPIDTGC